MATKKRTSAASIAQAWRELYCSKAMVKNCTNGVYNLSQLKSYQFKDALRDEIIENRKGGFEEIGDLAVQLWEEHEKKWSQPIIKLEYDQEYRLINNNYELFNSKTGQKI